MGKGSTPDYPTTTVNTGLFGKSTTSQFGSKFKPTSFQKQLVGLSEEGATNALSEYLNPDYNSEAFRQGDEYYTNKMQNTLQNNYLNPALANNLLRGSTASDIMRGFGQDLSNTEYERQKDYKNEQLNKLQAALLGYNNIYDISKGTTGLSQSLANSIANYNLQANQGDSGLGSIIGAIGKVGEVAVPIATALSDEKVKKNIKKLCEVDGINIYKFDYKEGFENGAKNQIGVIAQEIESIYPQAVIKDGEYLKVDYSVLPEKVKAKIAELRAEGA